MLSCVNLMMVLGCCYSILGLKGERRSGMGIGSNYSSNSYFEYPCGDGFCLCYRDMAFCEGQGKNLQYIPELSDFIRDLSFKDNYLPVINAISFNNISDLVLETLALSGNNIKTLSKNAFRKLIFLKKLYIYNEPQLKVNELGDAFCSLGKKINTIALYKMKWIKITEQLFSCLNDSEIDLISLTRNMIKTIEFNIFSGFKSINTIDLSHNKLLELEIAALDSLQTLDVSKNIITTIPNFCDDKLQKSYFPTLNMILLSSNQIENLNHRTFKCLPNLTALVLKQNPFTVIPDNFISPLQSLDILDISKITAWMPTLEPYAFNSSSLTQLKLEDEDDLLAMDESPELIFKYCPNLTYLSLSKTNLPYSKRKINAIFSQLKRIQNLDLSFTGLKTLQDFSFSKMTLLNVLNLEGNQIQTWNGTEIFQNSSISSLSMRNNKISVLNTTSFPSYMLRYIDELDLSANIFLCTCQTLESIKWLRSHADMLKNYPYGYDCLSPSDVSGVPLKDYNPSAESCAEKNILLLVSVPVSVIAVATMSIIFLVYKCRWRLRYGIYLFNNRYRNYDRLADSYGFEYAGFVIYSDADRSWVHNELIHRLEDEEGFRLCIRLRDFAVGKVHVDNIVDNMSLSEKIIVILSNNFARDEWCDFQLLLAETRLLKQNTDMLVIFMLEEINSDCLRASLYKLVTERQFALWSDDETGKDLFWKQAVLQMKKSTAKDYGTMA